MRTLCLQGRPMAAAPADRTRAAGHRRFLPRVISSLPALATPERTAPRAPDPPRSRFDLFRRPISFVSVPFVAARCLDGPRPILPGSVLSTVPRSDGGGSLRSAGVNHPQAFIGRPGYRTAYGRGFRSAGVSRVWEGLGGRPPRPPRSPGELLVSVVSRDAAARGVHANRTGPRHRQAVRVSGGDGPVDGGVGTATFRGRRSRRRRRTSVRPRRSGRRSACPAVHTPSR